tara:strand:- start:1226 stop:1690 length:465 start_codon:yes stop_codon:yes gene_type:complete
MARADNFYTVVDKIKEILLQDNNVSTVSYGDISRVATNKTTIYPLSHFVVNGVEVKDNTLEFNITIACMDIIDQTNDSTTDHFNGNDNKMDIFNTQLAVITRLFLKFKRYNMRNDGFMLIGNPNAESFVHRFEDDVAGFDATFNVIVAQDMSVC